MGPRAARFNLQLADVCRKMANAYLVDLEPLVSRSGSGSWTLHRSAFLADLSTSLALAPVLCRQYAAVAAARRGLVRKCLVLDLDETMWGGVVGAKGLTIGQGFPGSVYRALQSAILRKTSSANIKLARDAGISTKTIERHRRASRHAMVLHVRVCGVFEPLRIGPHG